MVSVFTTAGQTTDRRRRLIATESPAPDSELLREFGVFPETSRPAASPLERMGEQLIGRLISARLWKHLVIIAAVLLSTLMVPVLMLRSPDESRLLEALQMMAGASLPTVTAILLLLSGQLALLTGWIRSHSATDFDGRYRAWYWLSGFLFVLTGLFATGSPGGLTAAAAAVAQPASGQLQAARPAVLYVPLLAVAVVIGWRVVPDLQRNRASQALLLTSFLVAVACLAAMSPRMPAAPFPHSYAAVAQLAAALTFSACLLHCRFVAHINNDPPQRRLSSQKSAQQLKENTNPAGSVQQAADRDAAEVLTEVAAEAGAAQSPVSRLPKETPGSTREKPNAAPPAAAGDRAAKDEAASPSVAPRGATIETEQTVVSEKVLGPSDEASPGSRKQTARSGSSSRKRKAG